MVGWWRSLMSCNDDSFKLRSITSMKEALLWDQRYYRSACNTWLNVTFLSSPILIFLFNYSRPVCGDKVTIFGRGGNGGVGGGEAGGVLRAFRQFQGIDCASCLLVNEGGMSFLSSNFHPYPTFPIFFCSGVYTMCSDLSQKKLQPFRYIMA